ncbi:MAG: M20 aminoacylase family protein [Alphaproteobacteria bacterium]
MTMPQTTIQPEIAALKDEIATYRRAMHENPGTAYEEIFASDLVAEKLAAWDIPFVRGLGKTGIVGTITGRGSSSGKAIGLRADMDALDILEEPNKPYVSKIAGKMHGCGHDGHTAMLLGAAKYLSQTRNFDGQVHLIFQPAEEGARGANAMMDDGLFEKFPCDAVYALHNWPGIPRGKMAIRPGPFMAASDRFKLVIKGRGGHAAMPDKTIDPIVIAAQITTAFQGIVSRGVDPVDSAVISVTNFNAGTGADNVIPDTATLLGSVRSFKPETRAYLERKIEDVARGIAVAFGADIDFTYRHIIDPTINDAAAAAFCADIARSIVGADNVEDDVDPCMGGEDFGAMILDRPGAYIWVGQGESDPASNHNQGLHTPRYDFNDEIIPLGIAYFAGLVEKSLPLKGKKT